MVLDSAFVAGRFVEWYEVIRRLQTREPVACLTDIRGYRRVPDRDRNSPGSRCANPRAIVKRTQECPRLPSGLMLFGWPECPKRLDTCPSNSRPRAVLRRLAHREDGNSGRAARDDGRKGRSGRCRGSAEEPCVGRAAVGAFHTAPAGEYRMPSAAAVRQPASQRDSADIVRL